MNDFEERKTEIFRRARILEGQRRKARRAALMTVPCIFLFVCISVITAYYSGFLNINGVDKQDIYITVRDLNNDETSVIDDESAVTAVSDMLAVLVDDIISDIPLGADGPFAGFDTSPTGDSLFSYQYGVVSELKEYSIALTDKNGELHRYILNGHWLTDSETGMSKVLTDEELENLLELLGLNNK